MPRKPITLEGDALEWFQNNAPGNYRKPIIDGLASQFGIRICKQTVSRIANDLDITLRQSRKAGDAGRSTRKALPEAAIQRAVDLIKTHTLRQTTQQVCVEFGIDVSDTTIKRRIVEAGGSIGDYRQKPSFKPHNMMPIGTEHQTEAGHVMIKVCNDPNPHKSWRNKHVHEWEKLNKQPVPDGYMVRMADADRTDYTPENLVLMTPAQNVVINSLFKRQQLNASNMQSAIAIADIKLTASRLKREAV